MIVAGFGFTSRATTDSLRSALDATGHAGAVTLLAAPQDKSTRANMRALCAQLDLKIAPIPPDALEAMQTRTNSARSQSERRTGSVAEAAALAALGPDAELITPRHISDDRQATCAIAKGGKT